MKTATKESVEAAMLRYPKARRIAVENFTWSVPCDALAYGVNINLHADARAYRWNSDTVRAIRLVLGL